MTVYVDDARHPFGRMRMCHMWADSEPELLAMADAIGVPRRHVQRRTWLHFDVCASKRELAIRLGAVVTDRYGPMEHVARLTGNVKHLESVAWARAWRRRELF